MKQKNYYENTKRRKLKSKKKGATARANPKTKANIQTALKIVRDG